MDTYAHVLGRFLDRIGGDSTLDSRVTRGALDARDELDSRYAAAEAGAREEIAQAFSLLTKLPAKQIAVPTVNFKHGGMRATSVSMEEAVKDLTGEGYGMAQLLAVLQGSDCPLVQAYREALCAEWAGQWSRDIAEARA